MAAVFVYPRKFRKQDQQGQQRILRVELKPLPFFKNGIEKTRVFGPRFFIDYNLFQKTVMRIPALSFLDNLTALHHSL